MYKRVETKAEYEQTMEEALAKTQLLMQRFPEMGIYKTINEQLLKIRKEVIVEKIRMTPFEMIDRYQLGGIVAKNFDLEKEEYAQMLSDLTGLAYKYADLP